MRRFAIPKPTLGSKPLLTSIFLSMLLLAGVTPVPGVDEVCAAPVIDAAGVPAEVSLALPDILGIDFDDVLKVGGVLVVVEEYGPEINDFINELFDNNDARTNAATKVVVIVSPVSGKYIGAAQVTGPKAAVNKVRAVAQLEKTFMKAVRVKAMIPISTEDGSEIKRVQGVAVSAVIDIKL